MGDEKPHICQKKADMGHGRCGPPAEYVKKNGVIEVPDDYEMAKQGKKNAALKH